MIQSDLLHGGDRECGPAMGELVAGPLPNKYIMRNFINIIEEAVNTATVYHGDAKPDFKPHRGSFFSTDRDFASGYGPYVTEWVIDLSRTGSSLDGDFITDYLPLYDPYDDAEINSLDDYFERSSDTWEILETDGVIDKMMQDAGLAALSVYEGGIENYYVRDTGILTPVSQADAERV